jgi:AAA family ATP:ADP antiporter
VRAGEGATALLLALNVFLLLTAYYIIKPVREALILQGGDVDLFGLTVGKAELKSYASAGMALILVGVVGAYGRLASQVARNRLVTFVTLFFISNLMIFYVLVRAGVTAWLGVAFFLWVGIFNMMVVAQFWSFANDVYAPEQGKRLFPLVAFGASLGAVTGSVTASWIIPLGEAQMLLWSGMVLAVCIVLTNVIHRREQHRTAVSASVSGQQEEADRTDRAKEPMGKEGGFQLVFRDRYLLLIAVLMLLVNLVNTTGEFILGEKVSRVAAEMVAAGRADGLSEGQWIGRFYADFFSVVNILGLLMQLFLVSRILKYMGVRVALMVLPLIALGGYTVLAFGASLGILRVIKTLENATDYSLQNTTRNVLFLPTSREAKYKAKAAIDTFFVRVGDFASALLVFIGSRLAFSVEGFALVNAVLVLFWVVTAVAIIRRYRLLTRPGTDS